jgi:hypothetical protein
MSSSTEPNSRDEQAAAQDRAYLSADGLYRYSLTRALFAPLHDECGLEFPEPVTWWDDFFQEVEQASFVCTVCVEAVRDA